MWAGAGATRAIGFTARRENWIEIEIALGENVAIRGARNAKTSVDVPDLLREYAPLGGPRSKCVAHTCSYPPTVCLPGYIRPERPRPKTIQLCVLLVQTPIRLDSKKWQTIRNLYMV